ACSHDGGRGLRASVREVRRHALTSLSVVSALPEEAPVFNARFSSAPARLPQFPATVPRHEKCVPRELNSSSALRNNVPRLRDHVPDFLHAVPAPKSVVFNHKNCPFWSHRRRPSVEKRI